MSADVVPYPVLFNAWKHHAGWVRGRIDEAVGRGPAAVEQLAGELVVIGTRLMDLYYGPLGLGTITDRMIEQLRSEERLEYDSFRTWLEGQGGYAVVAVPDDGSRWTLRLGPPEGRYVHLHPGRYSPNTIRVQANTLKTAVLAHALAGLTGQQATDVAVVNEARKQFLGLPPVAGIDMTGGLGEVIALLGRGG